MKKFILILLCALMVHPIYAQLQTGFHYKIKNSTLTIYYTTDSGKTKIPKVVCKGTRRLKANILQDEKDPTILKVDFWGIDSATDYCINDTNTINSSVLLDESHYYFLKVEKRTKANIRTKFISIPYATTELGVTTIPFKYRFGNKGDSIPNDASASVTGGLYIGRKWGRTRYYSYQDKTRTTNSLSYTLAAFISPSVIALAADNTKNKTKTKSNEFGLGFGTAFLVSYEDINVGFLAGIDAPISGGSKQWFYANKPWIGFGIGYKLAILNGGN